MMLDNAATKNYHASVDAEHCQPINPSQVFQYIKNLSKQRNSLHKDKTEVSFSFFK
jgi:hypothetical protein